MLLIIPRTIGLQPIPFSQPIPKSRLTSGNPSGHFPICAVCPLFCIFLNSLFLSSSSAFLSSFSLIAARSALFLANRLSSAVSSGGLSSACSFWWEEVRSVSTVFRVLISLRET